MEKYLPCRFPLLILLLFLGKFSLMAQTPSDIQVNLDTVYVGCDEQAEALNPEVTDFSLIGLSYYYYNGAWSVLPNFDNLSPTDSGTVSNLDISVRNDNSNYGFVFTGFIYISDPGNYTFYTSSDDGSKLWINDIEVVNNDGLHGNRERSGNISLTAGMHAVEVQFFERGGGEVLNWKYAGPGISKQSVPASLLYNSDPNTLNYSWSGPNGFTSTDPNPSVSNLGTYILSVSNADTTVVDSLEVLRSPDPDLDLEGGWLLCGRDSLQLINTLATPSYQQGLQYAYYTGTWNALPDFSSLSPVKEGIETTFSLDERTQNDYFGFTYYGSIYLANSGSYTFYTRSDDGSRLWINGQLVVDNDGLHGTRERSGSINLDAGYHTIEAHFFEKGGAAVMEVQYAGPGISKQLIPDNLLFYGSPSTYQYAWTGPDGFVDSIASPFVALEGTYTLTITDSETACSSTDTAVVSSYCGNYLGKLFVDENANEIFDAGERRLDSIKITLMNSLGQTLDSLYSDSLGIFSFPEIDPGRYQLKYNNLPEDLSFDALPAGLSKVLNGSNRYLISDEIEFVNGENMVFPIPIPKSANLPVEWMVFEAKAEDEKVILNWTTASELNNERFVIERSVDANTFSGIGEVLSLGDTQSPSSYQFSDDNTPYTQTNTLYYRLRQIDLNGQFSYSEIVRVSLAPQAIPMMLIASPNPLRGPDLLIRYSGENSGYPLQLKVLSALGQEVLRAEVPGGLNQEKVLYVDQWPAGYYYIHLYDGIQSSIFKLVKP